MNSVIFVFLFASVVLGDNATCLNSPTQYICQTLSGSVILLDCTKEAIVTQQYNFILNSFLPKWNIDPSRLQFINSYGDRSSISLSSYKNHSDACIKVANKEDNSVNYGGLFEYVSNSVAQQGYFATRSRLIVFSSTTYDVDISETIPNYPEFAVVDLSGQGVWRNREDVSLLVEISPDNLENNEALANCLVEFTCGTNFPSGCPGVETDPRIHLTTVNPLLGEPSCPYNYNSSWNDIMVLFDTSTNVGETLLQQIIAKTKSEMAKFNIQRTESNVQMSTRVGVISFGDTASVLNQLGSMNNTDFNNLKIQNSNSATANLASAFEAAQIQFHGLGSRSNSRKIIVIASANLRSYTGDEASNFKSENGVIIAYDFSSNFSNVFDQIASPGYHILAAETTSSSLSDSLCDANCFCPSTFSSETNDANRGYPLTGCYQPIRTYQNFQLANYSCSSLTNGNGFITTAKSQQKEDYITKTLGSNANVWIGATYDLGYQEFVWVDDNTKVTGFHPIAEPRYSGQNCLFTKSGKWYPVDCRTAYQSICETRPCSSNFICQ